MKKIIFLLLSGGLFLLALGGCSKKGTDASFRLTLASEPPTLNPGLATDATSSLILGQIFEGLMTLDKKGLPTYGAAKSHTMSPDGLVYTFKLRDAKWSNGDPVTAEDFAYAWKWVLDPKNNSPYVYQLYTIKNAKAAFEGKVKPEEIGIKVIDDKTLEVTLERPTAYFLESLAFYTFFPINKKVVLSKADWAKDAGSSYVVNGPFKLAEWKHNDQIVLAKNSNYWDAANVKLDKVSFAMVNDSNTTLQMFRNKEIDWAGQPTTPIPTEAIPSLQASKELMSKPIAGVYWISFNVNKAPFDNINIRKAFAYAINRQALVENVLKGAQIPAMANVPPTMFPESAIGYFADNNIKDAKIFLEKGLKEMGLKSVKDLPAITYEYNTLDGNKKIAEAVQNMWKSALGIEVKIENYEWKVYLDRMRKGEHQVARMGWLGDFNDAVNFLELMEDSNGGNNFSHWENKTFQELIGKSRMELDPVVRGQFLRKADELLVDQMPITPIYFYAYTWVQNPKLKDVVIGPLGQFSIRYAYFDK